VNTDLESQAREKKRKEEKRREKKRKEEKRREKKRKEEKRKKKERKKKSITDLRDRLWPLGFRAVLEILDRANLIHFRGCVEVSPIEKILSHRFIGPLDLQAPQVSRENLNHKELLLSIRVNLESEKMSNQMSNQA
jgi:hypothetical protein